MNHLLQAGKGRTGVFRGGVVDQEAIENGTALQQHLRIQIQG
jgi:hypothetical protein